MIVKLTELYLNRRLGPQQFLRHERLPERVIELLQGEYSVFVESEDPVKRVAIELDARLRFQCQRCLGDVVCNLERRFELVLAEDKPQLDEYMSLYECVECNSETVDFDEIIADELILSLPCEHDDLDDCSKDVLKFVDYRAVNPDAWGALASLKAIVQQN